MIEHSPKFSVIVAAYNASATIGACIESIINQSFGDWELIIIDDGSADSTQDICMKYASREGRIKYSKQSNRGPASARNHGIDLALGEFIAFLDSDDTYAPTFLEVMNAVQEKADCDIAIAGFIKTQNGKVLKDIRPSFNATFYTTLKLNEKSYSVYNQKNVDWLTLFYHHNPGGIAAVWNKIYRRELIVSNNVRFDDKKRHGEDWKFNLELLCSKDLRLSSIDASLYNYVNTPNSITKTYREINVDAMFESAQLLLDINERYGLKKDDCVYRDIADGFISLGISLCDSNKKDLMYSTLDSFRRHPLALSALRRLNYLDLSLRNKILVRLLASNKLGITLFSLLNKIKH